VTIAWHPDHFRARRLPDAALVGLLGHLSDARQDDDSERAIIPYRPKRRRNRRPSKFTQRDISRAIRGVEASGKHVGSIRIGTDGSIQVAIAGADDSDEATAIGNEWDVVLRKSQQ
jgi:hypothetical protein